VLEAIQKGLIAMPSIYATLANGGNRRSWPGLWNATQRQGDTLPFSVSNLNRGGLVF